MLKIEKDKISVIVPVYNVEKYLNRCVESIINQTYKNLEIILIDDGSTDASSQMCDAYEDNRIVVIHKENEGLGLSRNVGISKATGEYILFVDSDDYLDEDMIENLYTDMKENNADTCIGGYKRVYADRVEEYKNIYAGQVFYDEEIISNVLVKMFGKYGKIDDHIEMSVWKVLFSRDIIINNNIKFPSEKEFISEDIIFDTAYYPKSKRLCISGDIGYNYCDNFGSLTTKYNPRRFELQEKLFLELKKRTNELGIYELSKQRMLNTLIAIARYSIKLEQKYADVNGVKVSKKNIQKICSSSILKEAFREYQDNDNIKSKIINFTIKNRLYNLLWLIMTIKNRFNI